MKKRVRIVVDETVIDGPVVVVDLVLQGPQLAATQLPATQLTHAELLTQATQFPIGPLRGNADTPCTWPGCTKSFPAYTSNRNYNSCQTGC